jgi:hypothetical protein
MRGSIYDHPAIDLLERFALNTCSEEELDLVETHILACDACVCALEDLEVQVAATKLALEQVLREQKSKPEPERIHSSWRNWFTAPNLGWAGAALAASAVCLLALLPVNVELGAERGSEQVVVVPEWRNAVLTISQGGLQDGPVQAEIVNENGQRLWAAAADCSHGLVGLHIPRMTAAGHYYARLYTVREHELLSEFPFEVKLMF